MSLRRITVPAVALAALHLFAADARAQSCTFAGAAPQNCSLTAHNLDATVPTLGKLSLTGTGTTAIPAAVADFEASEGAALGTATTGPTLTAKSNKTFNVTMDYPTTFTDFAATPIAKPQSEVAVRFMTLPGTCPTADAGYSSLAGTSATVLSSVAPSTVDRLVCVKVKWMWASDGPGSYRLPVTFKITAP